LRQKQLFLSKHDSTPPSPDEGGYRTKWLLVADGLMKREIAQGAIVADSFYLHFTGQEHNFSLTTFDNQNFCNTVCSMYTTTPNIN
jgi:hypothetical protein